MVKRSIRLQELSLVDPFEFGPFPFIPAYHFDKRLNA
jgi:hypothetical protein